MTNRRLSSFYPLSSLDGKNNYKRFVRIERDGSIIERVYLDVPDPSERERLICIHYLRHIARHFLNEDVGINILARDKPWDFTLELSSGEIFNLEITSIADIPEHFLINKSEERFNKWKSQDLIPFYELEKIYGLFPDDALSEQISTMRESGISDTDHVENPIKNDAGNIFLSNMPETSVLLEDLLKNVLAKKANKRHTQKERTVLIVDNRTSLFEISDYLVAASSLSSYLNSLPFPEIWFYTGYCSDNDGNNAEFSFAPLKVTDIQSGYLQEMSSSKNLDKNGKFVWQG